MPRVGPAENPLVYQPLSTGITRQLITKATANGIPMHTTGYGRTSAANGEVFTFAEENGITPGCASNRPVAAHRRPSGGSPPAPEIAVQICTNRGLSLYNFVQNRPRTPDPRRR